MFPQEVQVSPEAVVCKLSINVNTDVSVDHEMHLTLHQASGWNRSGEYTLLRDWRWSSYH